MLTDLISRLSNTTKSSRDLDIELTLVAHPWLKDCPRHDRDGEPGWITKDGRTYAPRYTELIDAALPGEDIIGTSEQSARPGQPIKWMAIQRMPKGRMPVSAIAHTEAIARRLAYLNSINKAP